MHKSRMALAVAVSLALAACSAETAETPDSPAAQAIAARQANFEAIKDSNDAMKAEAEAEAPDIAVFQTEAGKLLDHVSQIEGLFPDGSGPEAGVETEALPVIWEDRAGFAEAIAQMTEVASRFLATTQGGDIEAVRAGLVEVGETCRACHQKFRQQR